MDTEKWNTTQSSILYYNQVINITIKDITSIAGKWVQLENIILSEVSQTQKDIHIYILTVYGCKWILTKKFRHT